MFKFARAALTCRCSNHSYELFSECDGGPNATIPGDVVLDRTDQAQPLWINYTALVSMATVLYVLAYLLLRFKDITESEYTGLSVRCKCGHFLKECIAMDSSSTRYIYVVVKTTKFRIHSIML